jgi:exodeoxyribonuclease VIII
MILEPEKILDSLHIINANDFRTTAARQERDAALAQGKSVLLTSELAHVEEMVQTYNKNPLVKQYITGGKAEESIFWVDTDTGELCKCRPDYMTDDYIVDVKTTEDLDKFERSVFRYNYHVQAAHYLNGTNLNKFYILALSKQPPFDVEMYLLSDELIEEGKDICKKAIATLATCRITDNWPNKYGQHVKLLERTY